MQTKYMVAIVVMRDGSARYTVQDAWGRMICGGDTSLQKPAQKDHIKAAFRCAQGMLRAQIVGRMAQKR